MARKKRKKNTVHITTFSKPVLALMVVISMAAGIVSGIACTYSIIFLPAVIVFFWYAYACMVEWARRK